MDDFETVQPAPAGDLGDLSAVMDQAEAIEGADLAAQQKRADEQAQQAVASTEADLLGALEMARAMVEPMFDWWEDFGRVWGDTTLQRIANGGALVMQRHGWTLGDVMGQFGPYIALGMATIPPSFVTYKAVQAHKKAQEGKRDERPQQAQD